MVGEEHIPILFAVDVRTCTLPSWSGKICRIGYYYRGELLTMPLIPALPMETSKKRFCWLWPDQLPGCEDKGGPGISSSWLRSNPRTDVFSGGL